MYTSLLSSYRLQSASPPDVLRGFTLLCGLFALLCLLWPLLHSPVLNVSLPTIMVVQHESESPAEPERPPYQTSAPESEPELGSLSAINAASPSLAADPSITGHAAAAADDTITAQPEPAQAPSHAVSSPSPQAERQPAGPVRIPVLNYHSITVDPGNPATITPEKFQQQMAYLKENGYTTLTLKQFTDMMEGQQRVPAKPVLLTFDDGYADNYEQALPVLKELGLHATLFISPGMVEDGYFLDWEQIKELHQAGWDIQPHGMTHPHLPRLKAADQAYQILEARKQIEEQLGTVADVYCYPYGEFNAVTLKVLQENQFRYAFTIKQGWTTPDQDPLKLTRVFVNGEESLKQWISRLEKW